MFFVLSFFFSCSNDKTSDTSSQDDTSQQNDPVPQDTEPSSEEHNEDINSIRPFCKQQAYKNIYNGEILTDITYTWEGNTQETIDWYAEYNNFGYVTKSLSFMDGYTSNSILTYDCDGWCKILKSFYESGSSPENLASTEIEYIWEGNTQYQEARYWVYNEYGYVIESYDEGVGFDSTTTNEYECGVYWCKLLKRTIQTRIEEEITENILEYTWEELRQNTDNGYVLYNEYGYVLEQESYVGDSVSRQEYSYDCEI
jgi:hypothetical protein